MLHHPVADGSNALPMLRRRLDAPRPVLARGHGLSPPVATVAFMRDAGSATLGRLGLGSKLFDLRFELGRFALGLLGGALDALGVLFEALGL